MDLRHLRHFIAVAEFGSFSRAADKLCLTQPALTRSIKTLEEEVRAQLLDRQPSGVFLTAAGKTLFAHAKYILNENDRALERVRLTASGIVDEITVAVCPLQVCSLFDSAIDDFTAEHPQVSITLIENHVEEAVPLLLEGKVDVVFTTIPETTMPTGLIYERVRPSRFFVYAARSHPLHARKHVSKNELAQWKWVVLDSACAITLARQYFAAGNEGLPTNMIRTNSVALMRSMIVRGGAIGFLPETVMDGVDARILPASDAPVVRQAGLLYRAGSPVKPLVAAFTQGLRVLHPPPLALVR